MTPPDEPLPEMDSIEPSMVAVLRALPPSAKLATLSAMWRSAVTLVRCGVKAQHPEWTDAQVSAETARRMARGATAGGKV